MFPPFPIRHDDREGSTGALWRPRAPLVLSFVLAAALAAAGCAKPRAEGLVVGPPLDVPPPPARVLAPVELESVSATAGAPPAGAPEVPSASSVQAQPNVETTARQAPPPAPPPTGPSAAGAAASAEPQRAELRVVPSADDAAAEQLKTIIANANRDLARVKPEQLSENAKEHYAQARRYLEMAEQALRERYTTYALHLARAGATIASMLVPAR